MHRKTLLSVAAAAALGASAPGVFAQSSSFERDDDGSGWRNPHRDMRGSWQHARSFGRNGATIIASHAMTTTALRTAITIATYATSASMSTTRSVTTPATVARTAMRRAQWK